MKTIVSTNSIEPYLLSVVINDMYLCYYLFYLFLSVWGSEKEKNRVVYRSEEKGNEKKKQDYVNIANEQRVNYDSRSEE